MRCAGIGDLASRASGALIADLAFQRRLSKCAVVRSKGATSSALIHSAAGDSRAGAGSSGGASSTEFAASSSTIGDTIASTSRQIVSTAVDATSSHGTGPVLVLCRAGRQPRSRNASTTRSCQQACTRDRKSSVFLINGTSLQLMEGTVVPSERAHASSRRTLNKEASYSQGCATTLDGIGVDARGGVALPYEVAECVRGAGEVGQQARMRQGHIDLRIGGQCVGGALEEDDGGVTAVHR